MSVALWWAGLLASSLLKFQSMETLCAGKTPINRTIQYPPTPGDYPDNTLQTWTLEFESLINLVINITYLALEDSNGCKADFLQIYDPANIDRCRLFCANTSSHTGNSTFTMQTYIIIIKFRSDESFQDQGFSVLVSGNLTDRDEICENMKDESTSQISSRVWSEDRYPALLNCSWLLEAPSGEEVVLDFSRFDIEYSGPDCLYDRIEVLMTNFTELSQRDLVATFCGRRVPWRLETGSAAVIVRFITDGQDNHGGFLVKYRRVSRTDKPRAIRELKATPQAKYFAIPDSLMGRELIVGWRIQTHPGYNIMLTFDKEATMKFLGFHDGPDSTFRKIDLIINTRVVSTGFFLYVNTVGTWVSGFAPSNVLFLSSPYIARSSAVYIKGEYDYFQNTKTFPHVTYISVIVPVDEHPQITISKVTQRLKGLPNTNDCLLSGIALYDGVVSFGRIIGPFCDIETDYTADVLERIIGSTSVWYMVAYDYSNPASTGWHVSDLNPVSSKCRGYQLTRQMFATKRFIQDQSLRLNLHESNRSRGVQIVYRPSADCIVLQLLPFVSDSTEVVISLTGKFSLRVCRQWGFTSKDDTLTMPLLSKYNNAENCTSRDVSDGKTERLRVPLKAHSGWSKELISLELGPVSENVCSAVSCSSDEDKTIKLICGYIYGVIPEGCFLTFVVPDYEIQAEHVWEMRLGQMRGTTEDAYLIISEQPSDQRQVVKTRISVYQIGQLRAFRFRSMAGTRVQLSAQNINFITMSFQYRHTQLRATENDPMNYTRNEQKRMFNGHCCTFVLHEPITSWKHAQMKCKEKGGYLLSINTVEELDFVKRELDTHWETQFYGSDRGLIFIGLTDSSKVGDYRWEDGSPLAISDWYYPFANFDNVLPEIPKPPLDLGRIQPVKDTAQRCVAMVIGNSIYSTNWRKVPCGNESFPSNIYSICEMDTVLAVNTTTAGLSEMTFNHSAENLHCKPGWIFIRGHCFLVLTKTSYMLSSMWIYIAKSLCGQYESVFAQVDKVPRESLLAFLTSVGFRPGVGDMWVLLSTLEPGCLSLPTIKDPNLYKERLKRKSTTCQIEDGFAIHVICETDPAIQQPKCGPQQFSCHDGTCLNPDRVCDHFPDCTAGEDEVQCDALNYTYHCNDGQQISILRYCDFHVDCEDGSDESVCLYTNCTEYEYRCDNGQCIAKASRCDMVPNCIDGSDETLCDFENSCPGFKCPVTGCIPRSQVGDLESDCPDSTDGDEIVGLREHKRYVFYIPTGNGSYEKIKNLNAKCPDSPDHQRCHQDHVQCYPRGKSCIYDHDIYGNLLYCRNGAHLQHCREHECPDMFKCPDSYCIPHHKVCDGVQDCTRGEDEVHCDNRTCPHQLKCGRTNQCVSQQYVCDGQVHCKKGFDDERFCDLLSFSCPENCTCFGYSLNCSGRRFDLIPNMSDNFRVLDLSSNRLTLNGSTFEHLPYLSVLYLHENIIQDIGTGMFHTNTNLLLLDLSYNLIEQITVGTFVGLKNLRSLILKGNPIEHISEESFLGLSTLPTLELNGMQLTDLPNGTLVGLDELTSLDLSNNSIGYIHRLVLLPVSRLGFLNLENNPLDRTPTETFEAIRVKRLRTDSYFVCCYVSEAVTDCYPPLDRYTSCSDLLGSSVIQVIVWTFAVLALVGNGGVVLWRVKTKLTNSPSIFVLNLSISDFLMGVYLMSLAVADVRYKGVYALNDHSWRHSGLCLAIGAVATLSCEMSTFTLVCIAIDRTKRIAYPFTSFQFNRKIATITALTGWIVCCLICLAPFVFPSYFGKYYSRNAICVPFNFSDPFGQGWEFSFFLFVILNSAGILLVVILYALTYAKVKQTMTKAGRDDRGDLDVARKLTVVIMTNMLCIIPLMITNLISAAGEPINRDMASVLTAVILPINSALNPYLFTFSTIRSR